MGRGTLRNQPSLLIPGDAGFQRPGRLRWFPHVYWKSDIQRPTQSAPRGVLKFIPTVGCVTCRLDRLPKSWKKARNWDESHLPAHYLCPTLPRAEADSSQEEHEGAAVAQRVDSHLQKEGETTTPLQRSAPRWGESGLLGGKPTFTYTQGELKRGPSRQHPPCDQSVKAFSQHHQALQGSGTCAAGDMPPPWQGYPRQGDSWGHSPGASAFPWCLGPLR